VLDEVHADIFEHVLSIKMAQRPISVGVRLCLWAPTALSRPFFFGARADLRSIVLVIVCSLAQ